MNIRIAAVLVSLFLAGNAFADKTKTVTYKFKDSTTTFYVQHLDDSNPECLVSSGVSFFADSSVTKDDGTTSAFIFTASYIIDSCGSLYYGTLETSDPSVVTYVGNGVKGATIQGNLVFQTFDGISIPAFVNIRLWCTTPVEESKEKTKEVNDNIKIIRKSTSLACGGTAAGSIVVDGFDFMVNPQALGAALGLVKEGEMTITKKVKP